MAIDVTSDSYKSKDKKSKSEENKALPYDYNAEQALLGCIFVHPMSFDSIVSIVNAEDFYYEPHKEVFKAIQKLMMLGKGLDIIALSNELEQTQKLASVGGQPFLLALQSNVPSTLDIVSYAKIVADKSKARKLLKLCDELIHKVYEPNGESISSIYSQAEQKIFNLTEESVTSDKGPESINEITKRLVMDLQENNKKRNADGVTGVNTGYTELNNMTAGFHGGELIILAARPGVGKTTFAMNLIENISMHESTKFPALVFSLEMPSSQLAMRLMASMARIEFEKLKNYNLEVEDLQKLLLVLTNLTSKQNPPIFIDDTSELSPTELRTRARRLYKEYGGISAIMVDYVQLMKIPGYDANNRHLEVSECSHSLKSLAKELNVPVIALAQINRGVENRKGNIPQNSDLRESGALEQDADMIMFVHREELYNKDDVELKGKAEIIIGKQRNGPTGSVPMIFQGQYSRFEGLDRIDHVQ